MATLQRLVLVLGASFFLSRQGSARLCPFEQEKLVATDNPQPLEMPPQPPGPVKEVNCSWILEASDPDLAVEVKVTEMKLNRSPDCAEDYLAAYSGESTHGRRLLRSCGSDTPRVVSLGSHMTLVLQARLSPSQHLQLEYRQVPDLSRSASFCPRPGSPSLLVNRSGLQLTSPNYPNPYFSRTDCTWVLQASNDSSSLHVRVMDSDLELTDTCHKDYVIAYNGGSRSGVTLARWCGRERPVIYSSGPMLTLFLHADASRQGRGFRLKAKAISADEIRLVPGFCPKAELLLPPFPAFNATRQLASRNYPYFYPRNSNCVWVLMAVTPSFVVEVTVLHSVLEISSNCQHDSVIAHDGNTTDSPMLGFWCGETTPSYASTGRFLTINFVSNDDHQEKGFLISYRQVPASSRRGHGISLSVSLPLVALVLGLVLFVGCCVCKGRSPHSSIPQDPSSGQDLPPSLPLDPLTNTPGVVGVVPAERLYPQQSYAPLKNSPLPEKINGYLASGEVYMEEDGSSLRYTLSQRGRSPRGERQVDGEKQRMEAGGYNFPPQRSPSPRNYMYHSVPQNDSAAQRSPRPPLQAQGYNGGTSYRRGSSYSPSSKYGEGVDDSQGPSVDRRSSYDQRISYNQRSNREHRPSYSEGPRQPCLAEVHPVEAPQAGLSPGAAGTSREGPTPHRNPVSPSDPSSSLSPGTAPSRSETGDEPGQDAASGGKMDSPHC